MHKTLTLTLLGLSTCAVPLGSACAQVSTAATALISPFTVQTKNGLDAPYSDTGFALLLDTVGGTGDLAQAKTIIDVKNGSMASSVHGCTEPMASQNIFHGRGYAYTNSSFDDTYNVTSATLAPGTIVPVTVCLSGLLIAAHIPSDPLLFAFNDNIADTANLRFTTYLPGGGSNINSTGHFSWQNGNTVSPASGLLLNPITYTFNIAVGATFGFSGELNVSADAETYSANKMDTTVQVGAIFGMSGAGDVSLISKITGMPAPSTDTCTPAHLGSTIIPFLIPIFSAPEPGTLALLSLGVVGGIVARRRKK